MNMNLIYLIVTVLMFISFIIYIGNNQPEKGWKKRFHSIMQVIFFIINLLSLIFIGENTYKPDDTFERCVMVAVYAIPVVIYIISFICYLKKRDIDLVVPWFFYIMCFMAVISMSKLTNSEEVLQEKAKIISYQENQVKSTFINNSVEGIDYVIVKETLDGEVIKDIIKTRTYSEDCDMVKLHLHQNNSQIEEYAIVETYDYYLGFTSKKVREERIYEIYLTDDMYEQK